MERPTLKRGRQNAQYVDSEIHPSKKSRIGENSGQPQASIASTVQHQQYFIDRTQPHSAPSILIQPQEFATDQFQPPNRITDELDQDRTTDQAQPRNHVIDEVRNQKVATCQVQSHDQATDELQIQASAPDQVQWHTRPTDIVQSQASAVDQVQPQSAGSSQNQLPVITTHLNEYPSYLDAVFPVPARFGFLRNSMYDNTSDQRQTPLVERFEPPPKREFANSQTVKFNRETETVEAPVKINLKKITQYYEDKRLSEGEANTLLIEENSYTDVPTTSKSDDADISPLLAVLITCGCLSEATLGVYTRYLLAKDALQHNKSTESLTSTAQKPSKTKAKDSFLYAKMRPFSSITEIFNDLAKKVIDRGFLKACQPFRKQGLQVVTMCSGTESPIIAMQLLKEAIESRSAEYQHQFNFKHVASAEIIPFKQAYIQRNFEPPILFRDVTEFNDRYAQPHTAFGGVASQPDKVHMLVAGASCVDYSNLNNERKQFGQVGQSYSTFMGIISYCEWVKPPIIILENVEGAPWSQVIDSLKEIGYVAICFKIDSKDFYIPQTRQRGYVVAFHRETAATKGFDIEETFKTLHDTLQSMACHATAPFTDFIYGENDPELFLTRKLLTNPERNNVRRSNIKWDASRQRYAGHRATNKLGSRRPYTNWRVDGSCSPPDFTWIEWTKIQPERIWDTLDIKYLSHLATQNFDMNYKCRWAELSQNVDRDRDSRPWGIISCLTPSGIPWDSRRGGPVSGKEVLALQGIPADKLVLNRETSRQLQDLTGNAMTTTVVGAVIFSAIIASLKKEARTSEIASVDVMDSLFDSFSGLPELSFDTHGEAFSFEQLLLIQLQTGQQRLTPTQNNRSSSYKFSLAELQSIAKKTMQLCCCEGPTNLVSVGVKICVDCGHTCCASCAGNPQHNYLKLNSQNCTEDFHMPSSLKSNRLPPSYFADYIRKVFPSAIEVVCQPQLIHQLHEVFGSCDDVDIKDHLQIYSETVASALQGTFVFAGVQRNSI